MVHRCGGDCGVAIFYFYFLVVQGGFVGFCGLLVLVVCVV